MLEIASMNRMPRFSSVMEYGIGMGLQINMAIIRASRGAKISSSGEEWEGRIGSLIKSFTPSDTGWRRPCGPTIFGPFRSCI